jgi:hypothetical protein
MISRYKFALIVPCHNIENSFPFKAFDQFAQHHSEVLICYLNCGSTDKSIGVLRALENENPEQVIFLDMDKNVSKHEAIRLGMLHVNQNFNVGFIGFINSHSERSLNEWLAVAESTSFSSQYKSVMGNKVMHIDQVDANQSNSYFYNRTVKALLGIKSSSNFKKYKTGAKIFNNSLVAVVFNKPFKSSWFFDVELLLRIQENLGASNLHLSINPYPIDEPSKMEECSLNLIKSIKARVELMWDQVQHRYRNLRQLAMNWFLYF